MPPKQTRLAPLLLTLLVVVFIFISKIFRPADPVDSVPAARAALVAAQRRNDEAKLVAERTSKSPLEPIGKLIEKRTKREKDKAFVQVLQATVNERTYVLCTFTNKDAANIAIRRLSSYRVESSLSVLERDPGHTVVYRVMISPDDRQNVHSGIQQDLAELKPIHGWKL